MSPAPRRALAIDDPVGGREACHVAHPPSAVEGRLQQIPLGDIRPNPAQPRKRFDETALASLADSIGERGVLQPIIVQPRVSGGYELIVGERRWRASQIAGEATIPALIDDTVPGTRSLELALIENVAREDLTVIEEARTIALLLDDLQVTMALLAKRLGRSRSDLAHTVRLLDLPDDVIDLIDAGILTKGHGKALLTEVDHHRRRILAKRAADAGWSVRALEAEISRGAPSRQPRSEPHPDHQAAATRLGELITAATGCDTRARPHRAGYQVLLDKAAADRLTELLGAGMSGG
ncbi:MAG: ParB/RepB/Spo0J family partition protein [Solirubrobacteraceae bacterium]